MRTQLQEAVLWEADPSLQLKICGAINSVLHNEPNVTEILLCDDEETDCDQNPG